MHKERNYLMKDITIESIPVKANQQGISALEVQAYYSLGGVNLYSYKSESRGYYIAVTPVKYINHGNQTLVERRISDGIKKCVIECKRQTAKNAQAIAQVKRSDYQDLIDHVLNKMQISLAK